MTEQNEQDEQNEGNQTLPKLSEIMKPEDIVACDCSCQSFFDWGIQVVTKSDFGKSKRNKDFAHMSNVKICVDCLKPIVVYDGTAFDASEFISPEQIESLIQTGQGQQTESSRERTHKVPVTAMDP